MAGAEVRIGGQKNFTSLVVPVYNEAENILPLLERLAAVLQEPHETLLIYDFDRDTTLPVARRFQPDYPQLRLVRNKIGPGVIKAIKTGFAEAKGDVVVVTMADLSDDVDQIETVARMVRAGAAVVAPSRYMKGGRQMGGPLIKRSLSRMAGLTLRRLTGIGTHDPTNNFKGYSSDLLDEVEIESRHGFEIGLELTTKAHLLGLRVEEVPTTWTDRTAGASRFHVLRWMPAYLRWYGRCVLGTWAGERHRALRARAAKAGPDPAEDGPKG